MEDFGIKELYDIRFKAIDPLTFCGRDYDPGEVLLKLDRATYSVLTTSKAKTVAKGGYGNRVLIHWDEVKPMMMQIQQGILSKEKISLLTNNFLDKNKVTFSVTDVFNDYIPSNEEQEYKEFELKYRLLEEEPYFLYDENSNIIPKENYYIDTKSIGFNNEEELISVLYIDKNIISQKFSLDYRTAKESSALRIGTDAFDGFLELEAKTRVKDDTNGQECTGIFIIPKVRIMSDLSMQLGDAIAPYLYTFTIEAEPVGPRRQEYVCELHFLSKDLEADIRYET